MAPSTTTSTVALHIDGENHTLPVDHRTTLLDALREHLDLPIRLDRVLTARAPSA